ncbi:MAG TPA: acyl-CoA dehydrogenase family protein [Acidimicrobiales bacterium]|nr:acyl-CoA dehydrogenase family protein [Acidimicrobiales bacterium]
MPETITEEDFEREAAAFLRDHAQPKVEVNLAWGEGSDQVSVLPERTLEEEKAELEQARAWMRTRFDAGFGWITGPERFGGRQLTRGHQRRYEALEAGFDTPTLTAYGVGLGMVAPTILAHATDEVKEAYLRSMYRGDIVACQLFSEPGAGSDLAGLQTKAVRDGDEWVVSGQKVWTSGAHLSQIGEVICRTDPDAPKHKGLTGFVVDMTAPGVEVRPLRQITGGASFNEVFFNEARIPDSHRLGDVNGGWTVALTTLMNERAAIGGGGSSGSGTLATQRLIEMVRHQGKSDDPLIRQQLAQIVIAGKVAAYTNMRSMAKVAAGQLPGPEMSIGKLTLTANMRRTSELVSAVLGPKLVANSGEWGTFAWSQAVLGVPGMRIAGGTDEILRNIIGERVLGLPKEPPAPNDS